MSLSKENIELGQRAGVASVVAIALQSLKVKADLSSVIPLIKLSPDADAALFAALTAIAMTIYFLLRVADQTLVMRQEFRIAEQAGGPALNIPEEFWSGLGANLLAQRIIKFLMNLIEFWAPLALGILVCGIFRNELAHLAGSAR